MLTLSSQSHARFLRFLEEKWCCSLIGMSTATQKIITRVFLAVWPPRENNITRAIDWCDRTSNSQPSPLP